MSRTVRLVALAALVVAVAWTTLTVATAISGGDGEGGVFWTAIVLLVLIDVGLMWAAVRSSGRRSGL